MKLITRDKRLFFTSSSVSFKKIDRCLIVVVVVVKQMTQPSVFYTSPSLSRKGTGPNDRPSRVREVVQKFDMLGKSNDSAPIQINQTKSNDTIGSSSSSSTDSSLSENGIEGQVSTPESGTLPNRSHISTATIEIRPPVRQKLMPSIRRAVPAIPLSIPESNHGMSGLIFE